MIAVIITHHAIYLYIRVEIDARTYFLLQHSNCTWTQATDTRVMVWILLHIKCVPVIGMAYAKDEIYHGLFL